MLNSVYQIKDTRRNSFNNFDLPVSKSVPNFNFHDFRQKIQSVTKDLKITKYVEKHKLMYQNNLKLVKVNQSNKLQQK